MESIKVLISYKVILTIKIIFFYLHSPQTCGIWGVSKEFLNSNLSALESNQTPNPSSEAPLTGVHPKKKAEF